MPYYLLRIIAAFLSERTFSVKIEGTQSRICIIICGVPQGGVLSPTLFQIYINDIPLALSNGELTLLFADDIAFIKRYKYKEKKSIIHGAKEKAQLEVQKYLNQLESWMNEWRLTLAPQKCAQITFSKARGLVNDNMEIKLYGELINYEKNPKLLGIIFDSKLNFNAHVQALKKKVGDRVNLLKILSFDKMWRLDEKALVKMYKCLILSVLDYASINTGACCKDSLKDLEVIQNNALRIIFKKGLLEKTSTQELRERACLDSIGERHYKLMSDYYERALTSNNPLIGKIFVNFKKFKRREWLSENLAVKEDDTVNMELLNLIRAHNENCYATRETYPTTLCQASNIILNLIVDSYQVGHERGLT